jgi:hypothetical protein
MASETTEHLAEEKVPEVHLRVMQAQLERMRGMHYGYYVQFFQATHLFTVLTLANIALSLYPPFRAAILLLPFFIVYAGFFCAYLLTYNLFARIYSTALEKKINAAVGAKLLVAHEIEDAYIYRTPAPKFVAIDLGRPYTFIGASTVSFTFGGVVLYLFAAYRAYQLLPDLSSRFALFGPAIYWPLLAVWTLGHLAYLLWFYVGGKPEKTIAKIVSDAYGD